jgi:thioredoxin-like negative regulator of GroEL
MMRRRWMMALALGGVAGGMAGVAGAQGAEGAKFDAAAFAAAQAAGKPILVAVHADWCPVCTRQKPVLSRLQGEPAMKELVVFVVDFDTQKEVTQSLGVQKQSTLIVFRGATERDRSVGVTDEAALRALLAKAVG